MVNREKRNRLFVRTLKNETQQRIAEIIPKKPPISNLATIKKIERVQVKKEAAGAEIDSLAERYIGVIRKLVSPKTYENQKMVAVILAKTTRAKKPTLRERITGVPAFKDQAIRELLVTLSQNPMMIAARIQENPQILLQETIRRKLSAGRRLAWEDFRDPAKREWVIKQMADHALIDRILADSDSFAYWLGRLIKEAKAR
jgi:hypothetical protein